MAVLVAASLVGSAVVRWPLDAAGALDAVPASHVGESRQPVTAHTVKPAICDAITLALLQTAAGTNASEMILGTASGTGSTHATATTASSEGAATTRSPAALGSTSPTAGRATTSSRKTARRCSSEPRRERSCSSTCSSPARKPSSTLHRGAG